MKNIGIIGFGNLGSSIGKGLLNNKMYSIHAFDPNKKNFESFNNKQIIVEENNELLLQSCHFVILAVKPYRLKDVLKEIKPFLNKNTNLISVVSGKTIQDIKAEIESKSDVYRVMPNISVTVNESASCISKSNDFNQETYNEVVQLFSALGKVVEIPEHLMDASTVLGACGIAYVMRFIRAMTQGGIEIGFDSETAKQIAIQTVKGACELLIHNNSHPESEIDKVTTPKGCTIAGLNEMEHNGFSSALIKGIKTSFEAI